MNAPRRSTDPWRHAPVSELQDQVLPRWFVLTALVMVPVAIAALVAAFVVSGPDEVPVAARRPTPTPALTTEVGDLLVGDSSPAPLEAPCSLLEGLRVAGTPADRRVLAEGLAALCEVELSPDVAGGVTGFAGSAGVVRFAQFQNTGVDSTARRDAAVILVNARFSVTEPRWIAPLVVHDLVTLAGEPGSAQTALAARRSEAALCDDLFGGIDQAAPSRACADAAALLAQDDPLAALRAVGFS